MKSQIDIWQLGTLIDIDVTDLAKGGDSVGRHDGKVVFMPNGVPGDRLRVRLTTVKDKWARAEITDILKVSPERVIPICPLYQTCGGCQWQTVSYTKQKLLKRNQIKEMLVRIGNLKEAVIEKVIESEPFGYRNKVSYPVSTSSDKMVLCGYYQRGSHEVVDIDSCPIQDHILDPILKTVKSGIQRWPIYDETFKTEGLRHICMRVGRATKEVLITIVATSLKTLSGLESLASEWALKHTNIVGVCVNLNSKSTNTIFGDETVCIFGKSYANEILHGLTFHISSTTFFQVNTAQAERMVQVLINNLNLNGNETIIDAYCGIGTLALPVARELKSGGSVLAIDSFEESIRHGEANARINNITNIKFLASKAEDMFRNKKFIEKPNVVILDPPRKGCHPNVITSLLEIKPDKIVYISCNPSTLARDLEILCNPQNGSYILEKLIPIDLFPQTSHIESISFLKCQKQ